MDGLSVWADSCSRPKLPPVKDADQPLVGTSASGFDLTAGFLIRYQADQVDTARPFRLQSAAVTTPALRPENRRAMELLAAWMAEPDDLGEAWWADFERELQQHHFSLREL